MLTGAGVLWYAPGRVKPSPVFTCAAHAAPRYGRGQMRLTWTSPESEKRGERKGKETRWEKARPYLANVLGDGFGIAPMPRTAGAAAKDGRRRKKSDKSTASLTVQGKGAKPERTSLDIKLADGWSHKLLLERGSRFEASASTPKSGSCSIACNLKDRNRSCDATVLMKGKRGSLELKAAAEKQAGASDSGREDSSGHDDERRSSGGDSSRDVRYARMLHFRWGEGQLGGGLPTAVTASPKLRGPIFLGGTCEVELSPTGSHSLRVFPPSSYAEASITAAPLSRPRGDARPTLKLRVGSKDGIHTTATYKGALQCQLEHVVSNAKGSQATISAALADSLQPSVGVNMTGVAEWGTATANVSTGGGVNLNVDAAVPHRSLSVSLASQLRDNKLAPPCMRIAGVVFF